MPPLRGDLAWQKTMRKAIRELWPGAIDLVGKAARWANATLDEPRAGYRAQASAARTGTSIPGVLIAIEQAPLERKNLRLKNALMQRDLDGGPQSPDNLIDEIRKNEHGEA
jgi:hypothetical protein